MKQKKTAAILMMAMLSCIPFRLAAADPPPKPAGPLANYLSIPLDAVYRSKEGYYVVRYRDPVTRRTAWLRLEQGLVNSGPKTAKKSYKSYSLKLIQTGQTEYAPTGSAAFEVSLDPARRLSTRYTWTLIKGSERTTYKNKGEKLVLDTLEPGFYRLGVEALAHAGGKPLAAASTSFSIAALPNLKGVIKHGAFSENYTTQKVEVKPELVPLLPKKFGATSYTFQIAGEPPVAGESLELELKPGEEKEVAITATLANGQKLNTAVTASAESAPPESLVLSSGDIVYTTTGASVSVTAIVENARPGTGDTIVGWKMDGESRQGTKVLNLTDLKWWEKSGYIISASVLFSNGSAITAKDLDLKIQEPYLGVKFEQGGLVENKDVRSCRLTADLDVEDKTNVLKNVAFAWIIDGTTQLWDTSEIETALDAGPHKVEVQALSRSGKKIMARTNLPIDVKPGDVRMNPFRAVLEGSLRGTDSGTKFYSESIFTGTGNGTLRGPVRAELTGDAQAVFIIDLARQGTKNEKNSKLDGTLTLTFVDTAISGQSARKSRISGAVTSAIKVPLRGGWNETEGAEVVTGVIRGLIRVGPLSGDRRINGKVVTANLVEQPIRLVLSNREQRIKIEFGAEMLVLLTENEDEGSSVTSPEFEIHIVDPPPETKQPAATVAAPPSTPGRKPGPAVSAAPARPVTRRKFEVAPGFTVRVTPLRSRGPHDPERVVFYYHEGLTVKSADLVYKKVLPLPNSVNKANKLREWTDLAF